MKKDGILESMKSSRLLIMDESVPIIRVESKADTSEEVNKVVKGASTTAETESSQQFASDNSICRGDEGARVVYELRAKEGSRGMPKSGRAWKRVKTQRFANVKLPEHALYLIIEGCH